MGAWVDGGMGHYPWTTYEPMHPCTYEPPQTEVANSTMRRSAQYPSKPFPSA